MSKSLNQSELILCKVLNMNSALIFTCGQTVFPATLVEKEIFIPFWIDARELENIGRGKLTMVLELVLEHSAPKHNFVNHNVFY